MMFDSPVKFMNAAIGRIEGDETIRQVPATLDGSLSTEKCADSMMYTWEPRAISFGDSLDSHVQKAVDKKAISTV